MVQFVEILMLLSKERYLGMKDYACLERVSRAASAIAWLSYPVVTNLSTFGITGRMTYNAFADPPLQAFYRRFDCTKLTSLRVPWSPSTINLDYGISCNDLDKLLKQCPKLVELPPVFLKEEEFFSGNIFSAQSRSFESATLYCRAPKFQLASCKNRKLEVACNSPTPVSVTHLEIALYIEKLYDMNDYLELFIRRVLNSKIVVSKIVSLKIFIQSTYAPEYDMYFNSLPQHKWTNVKLAEIFKGWKSLEDLSITVQHYVANFILDGTDQSHLSLPALKSLTISPMVDESERMMTINDWGALEGMPSLQTLRLSATLSFYCLHYITLPLSQTVRKEILMRKISVLNRSKIARIGFISIAEDLATSDVLAQIGESGCLISLQMSLFAITPETLLRILKRNQNLESISIRYADGIDDKLFTVLAAAQLRHLSLVSIMLCTLPGIRRYINWRIRQIEQGSSLTHMDFETGHGEDAIVSLYPKMTADDIRKKSKLNFLESEPLGIDRMVNFFSNLN